MPLQPGSKPRAAAGALRRWTPLFLAAPLALSGCNLAVLDPKGPIAAQEGQILVDSVAIMLAIVIPTIAAIAGCAWWFRAGNDKARYRPELEFSGQVELVVWAIPTLTVLLLGGVIWISSHRLDPAQPIEGAGEPLDIQVVALDWKWLFFYPAQKVVSVNELVAPIGVPLRLQLTSGSVMTAFFVPQWGSLIYVMNGMTARLNLRADVAGEFIGEAAHISGDGFSDMTFPARAVSPEDFASWAKGAGGAAFDADAYKELERQGLASKSLRPLADAKLFEDIAEQKLPPAPGPAPKVRPTTSGG
jgi:cytochrome o ubiquinol oxidase subunit II